MANQTIPQIFFKASAWYLPQNRTLSASVHSWGNWTDVLLSMETDISAISIDDLPQVTDRRDLQISGTPMECMHVEGRHTTVVGHTWLKLHFPTFATRLEFLVTEPSRGGEKHPIILGKNFIEKFVESPLDQRMLVFIFPKETFLHCRCDGLFCGCRPLNIVVRYQPQPEEDEDNEQ